MNDKIWSLIGVPAVIALVVSVVRLAGELQGGPQSLFNSEAGGPFGLIGIAWLVPIFGIYFGLKLTKSGQGPASVGKAAMMAIGGLIATMLLSWLGSLALAANSPVFMLWVFFIACPAGLLIARMGWPDLGNVLVYYGVASRVPVIIIMFFALRGGWGTHYDAPPPDYVSQGWFMDWIFIGVIPQLTFWLMFTVAIGVLFGAIGAAIGARKSTPAAA